VSLLKPRAGEVTLLAESHGRALVEQAFYYPRGSGEEKREVFSLWQYLKGSPALIFPVTLDRQVIAIRQFRHGSNKFMIEVPGGLPQKNQSAKKIAERELLEETGFQAAQIIDLGRQVWSDSGAHNLKFSLFVGLGCRKIGEPKLDRTETIETILVPIKEWYEKIREAEIEDNRIITLSHLAIPYIGGRVDL
jgi:ADP-ribose diphosphatase